VQTNEIRVARQGSVATIWLDRPAKRNAMSYGMWADLEQVATQLATDREVRVVVLRGAGGHFCAGADITELRAQRQAGERSFSDVNAATVRVLAAEGKTDLSEYAIDPTAQLLPDFFV